MRALSGSLQRACIFVSLLLACSTPIDASAPDTAVAQYGSVLRSFNPSLSRALSQDMAAHVLLMASYYTLDPRLLVAIVGVESSWKSRALSHAGALGLGQLMPETAQGLGVLADDAYENLDGTARYLRRMIQRSGPNPDRYALALASYNAGPEAVTRYGGIPPFSETRSYVTKVMALWHDLQARLPGSGTSLPTIARIATRTAVSSRKVVRHMLAPKVVQPMGSVAAFASLDLASVQDYYAYDAVMQPAATPEPKSFKRWISRAFGGRKH
jgi:hypothetical protein